MTRPMHLSVCALLVIVACSGSSARSPADPPKIAAPAASPTEAPTEAESATDSDAADVGEAAGAASEPATCVDGQGVERPAGHWLCRASHGTPPTAVPPPAAGAPDRAPAATGPTLSPEAAAARARILAGECVDPRRLEADPAAYVGKEMRLSGKALTVTQHEDYTWVQLMAVVSGNTSAPDTSLVIEVRPKDPAIVRGESYFVFGTGAGTEAVTRTLTGASQRMPKVRSLLFALTRPADAVGCWGDRVRARGG